MKEKILIVDDNPAILKSLKKFIYKKTGMEPLVTEDPEEAIEIITLTGQVSIVITDIDMPKINGFQLIKRIKDLNNIPPEFIVLSGVVDVNQTVALLKNLDVYTVIPKPFDPEQLITVLKILLEKSRINKELQIIRNKVKDSKEDFIIDSPEMKNILNLAENFAKNDNISILLLGESGTGKSVLARRIHELSERRSQPFVEINCPTIPENLFESELFGYKKGAFTGAETSKSGKLSIADGGTVFLDEIGDLTMSQQVKLLRFIENKKFWPLGSTEEVEVDVRIISATNKNLAEAVKNGTFRQDLYYRLNVGTITLPPLRERKKEIKSLLYYYINYFNVKYNAKVDGIDKNVLKIFLNYKWRGNIRELRNVIERLVILKREGIIDYGDLKMIDIDKNGNLGYNNKGLKEAVDSFEMSLIQSALETTGGNKKAAAELLKIKRTTLLEKIKKYGL